MSEHDTELVVWAAVCEIIEDSRWERATEYIEEGEDGRVVLFANQDDAKAWVEVKNAEIGRIARERAAAVDTRLRGEWAAQVRESDVLVAAGLRNPTYRPPEPSPSIARLDLRWLAVDGPIVVHGTDGRGVPGEIA